MRWASNAKVLSGQAAPLPIRIASKSVRSTAVLERILGLDERFRGSTQLHSARGASPGPPRARGHLRRLPDGGPQGSRRARGARGGAAGHAPGADRRRARAPRPDRVGGGTWLGADPRGHRHRPELVAGARTCRAHRSEALADPHARASAPLRSRDRRAAGDPAGRGDGVRGAHRRGGRRHSRQAASQRRDPDHAVALARRVAASGFPVSIAAIRDAADDELEWVNAGGTGSLARSKELGIATELTAGSGFYAPALFDTYRSLDLTPAAFFCLPIVRRPHPGVATALGGGYIASGAPGSDRLPQPYMPAGLTLDSDEARGRGPDAARRRRGEEAPRRRSRLHAPREGGRAVRAVRLALSDRGRRGRRPGRDLPGRRAHVPVRIRAGVGMQ